MIQARSDITALVGATRAIGNSVAAALKQQGRPPFLREFVEMHYLLTHPLIVDNAALQQLLGGLSKTPYPEGVRQSLAAEG